MSLDVYLESEEKTVPCVCECGHEHTKTTIENHYWRNITHNLGKMAQAAGIYEHLWRPDEIGIAKASELIEPLNEGLRKLQGNPEHFEQFNPPNGWGDYDGLVDFVQSYLNACRQFPQANIYVSR